MMSVTFSKTENVFNISLEKNISDHLTYQKVFEEIIFATLLPQGVL